MNQIRESEICHRLPLDGECQENGHGVCRLPVDREGEHHREHIYN